MRISDWSSDVCSSDLTRRREVDVLARQLLQIGAGESFDVGLGGVDAVFPAQQVFEQDLVRVRDTRKLVLQFERLESVVAVGLGTDGERGLRFEALRHGEKLLLGTMPWVLSIDLYL